MFSFMAFVVCILFLTHLMIRNGMDAWAVVKFNIVVWLFSPVLGTLIYKLVNRNDINLSNPMIITTIPIGIAAGTLIGLTISILVTFVWKKNKQILIWTCNAMEWNASHFTTVKNITCSCHGANLCWIRDSQKNFDFLPSSNHEVLRALYLLTSCRLTPKSYNQKGMRIHSWSFGHF